MHSGEKKGKKKREEAVQFEFCDVCKINHSHGRKHRYLPNHLKSLSTLLSRFQDKLSRVKFYLKNPSFLLPEHAHLNRFWCIFCEKEVVDLGISFGCCDVIRHLGGDEHLKRLKSFLWKHGGGMERVSSFVVSEIDLLKWEKKCEAARMAHPNSRDAGETGPMLTEDIHNGLAHKNIIISEENTLLCNKNKIFPGVQPLHSHTIGIQERLLSNNVESSDFSASSRTQEHHRVTGDESTSAHESSLDSVIRPPWLKENEGIELILGDKKTLSLGDSSRAGRSRKLNPNRVGAAWAERRKMELEMERRGLVSASNYSDDWLPNFGRVWQEGTRKDSRKEFEKEKCLVVPLDPEVSSTLKPYISKRKRRDEEVDASGGDL